MEKILKYLEQLDLSEIEAKLYLTLLQTGPNSVRDIANAIGIKRTTAYLYVDQLEEKGLIIKTVHKSHPQIEAIPPETSLEHLVKEKVKNTQTIQSEFSNILQSIHTAYPPIENPDNAEIKYYKGKAGVTKIYEEALEASEVRTYIKLQEPESLFPNYFEVFENAFKKNSKLTVKEIIYDFLVEAQNTHKLLSLGDRYAYKLLPRNMKVTSEDILIYDGKVAIINFRDKKGISGTILQSIDAYNNFVEFFDYIWENLPEVHSTSSLPK